MKILKRRAEVATKVLDACRKLIGDEIVPTGRALRALCPGHCQETLIEIRDQLIADGRLSFAELWPAWTDERSYTLGPVAERWSPRTDAYRFELGPKKRRPRPPQGKRLLTRNLGFVAEEVRS